MWISSIYIYLFILLVSCKSQTLTSFEQFDYELTKNVFDSSDYKVFDKRLNHQPEVQSPMGVWTPIIEFSRLDEKVCLYYKMGSDIKHSLSELGFEKKSISKECSESFSGHELILRNIDDLKIDIKKFDINISFNLDKVNREIKLPIMNIKDQIKMEKYSGKNFNLRLKSLFVSNTEMKFETPSLEKGELCYDIDDECRVIVKNSCQQCKFGSIPVMRSKCDKDYSRICGPVKCGTKGQPACLRGHDFSLKKELELGCLDKSEAVFCGPNLIPVCSNNKIVICL